MCKNVVYRLRLTKKCMHCALLVHVLHLCSTLLVHYVCQQCTVACSYGAHRWVHKKCTLYVHGAPLSALTVYSTSAQCTSAYTDSVHWTCSVNCESTVQRWVHLQRKMHVHSELKVYTARAQCTHEYTSSLHCTCRVLWRVQVQYRFHMECTLCTPGLYVLCVVHRSYKHGAQRRLLMQVVHAWSEPHVNHMRQQLISAWKNAATPNLFAQKCCNWHVPKSADCSNFRHRIAPLQKLTARIMPFKCTDWRRPSHLLSTSGREQMYYEFGLIW